jgi:hypothetical protein
VNAWNDRLSQEVPTLHNDDRYIRLPVDTVTSPLIYVPLTDWISTLPATDLINAPVLSNDILELLASNIIELGNIPNVVPKLSGLRYIDVPDCNEILAHSAGSPIYV